MPASKSHPHVISMTERPRTTPALEEGAVHHPVRFAPDEGEHDFSWDEVRKDVERDTRRPAPRADDEDDR